jgi:hypothetical protein
MHYKATERWHAAIEGDGLLLIDSGGQYLGGTTDITRVVPVGAASAAHRRDFTLVLKGVIGLSTAHFPRGTKSPMLDALARAPLWAAGIEYGHGTGHGVGYFLNVHEGPQSISPSTPPEAHTAMEPGMITSVEPGLYLPGRYGIRIENLVLNVPAEATEFGEFLRFETLTLCPIDTRWWTRRCCGPTSCSGLTITTRWWRGAWRPTSVARPPHGWPNARRPSDVDRTINPRQRRRGAPQAAQRQPGLLDGAHRRRPVLHQRTAGRTAAVRPARTR